MALLSSASSECSASEKRSAEARAGVALLDMLAARRPFAIGSVGRIAGSSSALAATGARSTRM